MSEDCNVNDRASFLGEKILRQGVWYTATEYEPFRDEFLLEPEPGQDAAPIVVHGIAAFFEDLTPPWARQDELIRELDDQWAGFIAGMEHRVRKGGRP
jgi:hypothetical protein